MTSASASWILAGEASGCSGPGLSVPSGPVTVFDLTTPGKDLRGGVLKLEAETGFSDRLLHGEAVAAGMALAFRFSAAQGLCPAEDAARVSAHLNAVGLPSTLKAAHVDASGATLVGHMMHDKKMAAGRLPFLLARGIGRTFVDGAVDLAAVQRFLDSERA